MKSEVWLQVADLEGLEANGVVVQVGVMIQDMVEGMVLGTRHTTGNVGLCLLVYASDRILSLR